MGVKEAKWDVFLKAKIREGRGRHPLEVERDGYEDTYHGNN
jgi:hypothetical protein